MHIILKVTLHTQHLLYLLCNYKYVHCVLLFMFLNHLCKKQKRIKK